MSAGLPAVRAQLSRQVAHWSLAATALGDLSRVASPPGWQALEGYLGVALQRMLTECGDRLNRQAGVLRAELLAAEAPAEIDRLRAELIAFRERYLRAETLVEFFGEAINGRNNAALGAYLRGCDVVSARAMEVVLGPLGQKTPPVLTYVDKGLGASILKAGLRLWDGRSINPVAAIRIVRHNLWCVTSIFHEAGHQVAHALGWVAEASAALERSLSDLSPELGRAWSDWTSEIIADAFAFAHSGFAAVAALHDVLAGSADSVFRLAPGDPHPIGYLRVLLGTTMCGRFFGAGPWDDLSAAWKDAYERFAPDATVRAFVRRSELALPRVVEVVLEQRMRVFGGASLAGMVDPGRVKPEALIDLERTAGPTLFASDHWINAECVRLVALSGYRAATEPERARAIYDAQEQWMMRLGAMARAT